MVQTFLLSGLTAGEALAVKRDEFPSKHFACCSGIQAR